MGWCSGANGIKIPQRILKLKDDGIVGPKTLLGVNLLDPDMLFEEIYNARVNFIERIVSNSVAELERKIYRKATEKELLKYTQKKYLKGWLNRLEAIKTL